MCIPSGRSGRLALMSAITQQNSQLDQNAAAAQNTPAAPTVTNNYAAPAPEPPPAASPTTFVNETVGEASSADTADTGRRRGRRSLRVRVPTDGSSTEASATPRNGSSLTVPLK